MTAGTDDGTPPPGRVTGRGAVVGLLAVTAAVLLAVASRPWLGVELTDVLGGDQDLDVSGSRAAPVVPALALVALACAGATTIARRAGRTVALAVAALAGAGALVATGVLVADPFEAARPAVAEATGLTTASVVPDAADAAVSGWPWAAVVVALLLVAVAGQGLRVQRRWTSGRRFDPAGGDRPGATPDPADTWDALSRGDDPTGDHR